ncbi:transcription termination factor MTERF15, mitochondrial-like [Rosa sericea]
MVRLGSFTTFASKTKRYIAGYLKPSLFTLQTHHLLCTHTIVSPKREHSFTVNYLINSCGLSPEGAISASKRVKLGSAARADSVLAHFRNHGFSGTQIAQVIRSCPKFLAADFEKTLLPKLEYFSSVGLSRQDLARVVSSNPNILGHSLEKQIIPVHKFIRSLLSEQDVIAVLKRGSRIFSANQCNILVPNIKLLIELGMPQSCISRLLTHCTNDVIVNHEKFVKAVHEAKEMGFDMENSRSLWAIRALCRKNKLDHCRQVYMMRWGWSEDDVLSAFRMHPPCMIMSVKKLMQVMDFLVNKMGWPSRMIAKHPLVLSFSFEKRIIPRCSVVKVLMLRGLKNENLNLNYVLQPAEKEFLEKFVTKYLDRVPQLLSVYQGNVDIQDAKVLVP